MKNVNKGPWHELYGETPDSFRMKVEEALGRLEEEKNMKKRYKVSALLIAAALIVLMAGAAVAGGMGMIDRMNETNDIRMLPGTEQMLEKDLGTFELPLYTVTVEEAVHDQHRIFIQLRVTPNEPEKYILYNTEYEYPEREALFTYAESGHSPMDITGSADGRQVLFYDLRALGNGSIYNIDGNEMEYDDVLYNEDGSATVWIRGFSQEEIKEKLKMKIDCWWGVQSEETREWMRKTSGVAGIGLPKFKMIRFEVETAAANRKARLEPLGESEKGELKLYSGELEFNPMRGYASIRYYCSPAGYIGFTDADGNRIGTGATLSESRGRENGERYIAWSGEMQPLDPLPETIWVTVYGDRYGDEIIDRIECRVVGVKEE